MITVYRLVELFVEPEIQEISIYNCYGGNNSEIFRGFQGDIPENLGNQCVAAIDNIESGVLTISINAEN